jgi:hypothetical protein
MRHQALEMLRCRETFNLNNPPSSTPVDDSAFFAMIGSGPVDWSVGTLMRSQWEAHRASWVQPVQALTAAEIYAYWERLLPSAPELSELAIKQWLKPISSGTVERVYSILSDMSESKAQQMKRDTLYFTLYQRSNQHVVDMLVKEHAETLRMPPVEEAGPEAAAKRARLAVAFSAASSALAAEN